MHHYYMGFHAAKEESESNNNYDHIIMIASVTPSAFILGVLCTIVCVSPTCYCLLKKKKMQTALNITSPKACESVYEEVPL